MIIIKISTSKGSLVGRWLSTFTCMHFATSVPLTYSMLSWTNNYENSLFKHRQLQLTPRLVFQPGSVRDRLSGPGIACVIRTRASALPSLL